MKSWGGISLIYQNTTMRIYRARIIIYYFLFYLPLVRDKSLGASAFVRLSNPLQPHLLARSWYTSMEQATGLAWCMGIKGEMSGTVCVTFTWDTYMYMWVVYSFCLFCCSFIIVTWWYVWCIVWTSGRVGVNSIQFWNWNCSSILIPIRELELKLMELKMELELKTLELELKTGI